MVRVSVFVCFDDICMSTASAVCSSVSCSAAVCWLYGRAIDFENFCGEFNDKVGCKIFGNGYPFLGKKTHRPSEADEPDFIRIFFFVFEVYTPNRTSQSGKLLLVQSKSTQNCFDFLQLYNI